MVLPFLSTFISQTVPTLYYAPSLITLVVLTLTYAYAQGRRTTRDRDLHGRTIILTGAFTPLGLTLLEHLAKKGAHVIVLLPTPSLTSVQSEILSLLRTTTSNEFIYAEPCPLESPKAIQEFCRTFTAIDNEQTRRIDALILAHEYSHIGRWKVGCSNSAKTRTWEKTTRDTRTMATFLFITLLLPAMLVAPADRDIRIINVVNPFYAVATKRFSPVLGDKRLEQNNDVLGPEGHRALRTVIFTRHLQRILDALPSPARTNIRSQKSNIMAVTVSPGVSRTDTVAPFLLPSSEHPRDDVSASRHWIIAVLHFLCSPLLYFLTKSPSSSMQSILHVLCVPRPVIGNHIPTLEDSAQVQEQDASANKIKEHVADEGEEVLVPGALYAECSVVGLSLGDDEAVTASGGSQVRGVTGLGLGGEKVGRTVWEDLEKAVRDWAKEEQSTESSHGS